MKRFSLGLVVGIITGLILATTSFALAADQIKLIVNNKEIQCDVPPQFIDGRVVVPVRFLAEALGATVVWDDVKNAVIVDTGTQNGLDDFLSLREIDAYPGASVISDANIGLYVTNGTRKILLFPDKKDEINKTMPISVMENDIVLENSQAYITNKGTCISKNLLIKYGFIPAD